MVKNSSIVSERTMDEKRSIAFWMGCVISLSNSTLIVSKDVWKNSAVIGFPLSKDAVWWIHCHNWVRQISAVAASSIKLYKGTQPLPIIQAAKYWIPTRILCKNPSQTDACGECSHCRKVKKLVHPDLHFVYPVIGSDKTSEDFWPQFRELLLKHPWFNLNQWLQHLDSENKQANIPAKECALILQKMSLKPFESPNKVLIIWLPEYLGKDGNRLLKLLEEPPGHTYIFAVTRNKHKILNTILSRWRKIAKTPSQITKDVCKKSWMACC